MIAAPKGHGEKHRTLPPSGGCPARWADRATRPSRFGLLVAAMVGATAAMSWTFTTWFAWQGTAPPPAGEMQRLTDEATPFQPLTAHAPAGGTSGL